jgi:hypothetical protein
MNMKKLLTFLFALMMISALSFGAGNQFVWNGSVNTDWQITGNWTITNTGGTATWPGQNSGTENGDYAIFNDGNSWTVINVPTCTLSRLEITPLGPFPTYLSLEGAFNGATITFDGSISYANLWNVKIDDNCDLNCNGTNKVKIIVDLNANFWQKNASTFEPATYVTCTTDQGFTLKAGPATHGEYIQQLTCAQPVMGWQEFYLSPGANRWHYISLPITTVVPPTGEFLSSFCRTHNTLCVFSGDYVRKYINGTSWDNWLGACSLFTPLTGNPIEIETGRGYEYLAGSVSAPAVHTLFGTFNSGTSGIPILSYGTWSNANGTFSNTISAVGWNLIGNPYASSITFGEVSGAPTAGQGWTWNNLFTDPVAYWWDNNITPGGAYRYYNWYTGDPQPFPPNLPGVDPKVIARGQAFFVHVTTGGINSDITVSNDARVFRDSYLIGKSSAVNKLNLSLNDASGNYLDNVYVSFREDASTTDFDRLLDAYKLFNDITNVSQLYGKTTDNIAVVQKSLKLTTGNIMYPVYMKVSNTGTYSIDATSVNTFSQNTGILLKDNKTNTTVDLKVNPVYTFTATAGDDDARFSLYFSNVLYGIEKLNSNAFTVYSYDNSIYIQNNDPKSVGGTILVYDMIGKQMMQQNLNSDAITRINTNLNKGFYIVSIKTDNGVYNQKVYLN